MSVLKQLLAGAVLLVATASAAPEDHPAFKKQSKCKTSSPIPPKDDPWYSAPKGFADASPGDILRMRRAPGNLTDIIDHSAAAYNILYRTTDSQDQATWAVTTVFVPDSPTETDGDSLVLSYQIPYDSADLNASPSYQMYKSKPRDVGLSLDRGWYVNVPDYEGPLASFTAGVMSGHATLDSIRAVRAAQLDLAGDARCVMWGYSGGALASEWAAELQKDYAPETDISGAALGGLTPNVTSVMMAVDGTLAAGLIPAAVLGISSQFPDVQDYIVSQLKDDGAHNKSAFLATRNYTLMQAELAFLGQEIGSYFKNGISFISDPKVQRIIESDGIMGLHGVPQMPLYVYKAIEDQVSPIEDTDELVHQFCDDGVDILYVKNPIGGHSAEAANGRPGAYEWIESVFSGKLEQDGCQVKTKAVNITDSPLRRRSVPGAGLGELSW